MNVNATSMNETNTFPLFHCNAKAFYERLITENTVMYVSKKTSGGRMRGESVYMCVREREKKYRCKNNEIFPYMEYDCFFHQSFISYIDYGMNAQ